MKSNNKAMRRFIFLFAKSKVIKLAARASSDWVMTVAWRWALSCPSKLSSKKKLNLTIFTTAWENYS